MVYGTIPSSATLKPTKFTASVPEQQLKDFKDLLRLSQIGPQTYENLQEDRSFGVTHKWLTKAKQEWESSYDW